VLLAETLPTSSMAAGNFWGVPPASRGNAEDRTHALRRRVGIDRASIGVPRLKCGGGQEAAATAGGCDLPPVPIWCGAGAATRSSV
jgi:hypothetical protein